MSHVEFLVEHPNIIYKLIEDLINDTTLLFNRLIGLRIIVHNNIQIHTMLCGTDNVLQNIRGYTHIQSKCGDYLGMFLGILSVPQKHSYGLE